MWQQAEMERSEYPLVSDDLLAIWAAALDHFGFEPPGFGFPGLHAIGVDLLICLKVTAEIIP